RLLDDFGAELGEHHRRRDDRVPVAEDERMDARLVESITNGVGISRRRLAAGDVHGISRGAEGRDELAKGGVDIRGEFHQRKSVVTQASDKSTPEPPAPVMITTFSPFGVGSTCRPRANWSMSFRLFARMTPHWRSTSS